MRIQNISITPKSFLLPFFAISVSPQPWFQATTDVFFSDGLGVGERTTCFILKGKIQQRRKIDEADLLEFHRNGIVTVDTLCLVSLIQHHFFEIYLYYHMYQQFIFISEYSILRMYRNLFINSSVYGHLICFQAGTLMSKAE